uniref:hypothetical protein n=1 Tax=Alistipes shahii TaxID=328814 RepID=UPI003FEE3A85
AASGNVQEVQLPHYRLQRNKNGAKAERKKRGRFASKPAPFLATFSRDFVSRLRHRAGIVRRVPRREGCVRDKQEAQKPTIAPGSGFQPPHYRLERKKNNRQPACPEREAVKA